jgi:putative mRNA 3-end processing factor
MESTRVGWLRGITLIYQNSVIRFDPDSTRNNASSFISHCHGDHTAGFNSKGGVFSTIETYDIYVRGYGRSVKNFTPITYDCMQKVEDIEVIPHNAGHMLGSTLFEVRTPESTLVYTGDLNAIDTLTTSSADPVECDTLIIESTYGHPRYVFPPREETYTNIVKWAIRELQSNKIPVFKLYPAGKSQEVIRLFNLFTKIPVVTHHNVTRLCDIHVKHGLELKYFNASSEVGEELLCGRECVYVVPMNWSSDQEEQYSKATATGWAVRYRSNNVTTAFPLSSHADFEQLVNFVERTKAKQVYTVYGFKEVFSDILRHRLDISARPIFPINQKTLGEFSKHKRLVIE